MDAASQPTLNQLIFLRNEESRAKANLERALECYGEQLPLDDPYGVNPRKPHISEVLNIFRAFINEMCEIRRRTPDVNAAADADYVYTAVMSFCRMTRSGVAMHQLPDDPAFRNQIQVAIRASMFGSAEPQYSSAPSPLENARDTVTAEGKRQRPNTGAESDETPNTSNNFDFTSEAGRIAAIEAYTHNWIIDHGTCSEASLARTARVDPADLSKWKRGLLPVESDKAARIEAALRNNTAPTPAPKAPADS
jgi:hypothetical protein